MYLITPYVLSIIPESGEQLKFTVPCDFVVVLEYTQLNGFELIFKNPLLGEKQNRLRKKCEVIKKKEKMSLVLL